MISALAALALATALAVNGQQRPEAVLTQAQTAAVIAEAKVVTTAMAQACERLDSQAATKDFLLGPEVLAVASAGEVVDAKEYREGLIVDNGKSDIETPAKITELYRLRQLEKEHAILKEEHALLKKAIRFCSELRQKSLSSSSRTEKSTK